MPDLTDSFVLVTGATDGLGRGLAIELAAQDAVVLVHGRNRGRGEAVINEITSSDGRCEWYEADLSSLARVRALAQRVAAKHQRLDALVNNAGIGIQDPGGGKRVESVDGYELRFAVNYLAPYLLTRLLLPLLKSSAPSRIVNVASGGQSPIHFDDVMLEHDYDGWEAYGQSKLALVSFTFDLADELKGTGVTATCLHPGTFMPTKMVIDAGIAPVDSLESGIEATMRLIASQELEGKTGAYFVRTQESRARSAAYDLDARRRLRELSDRLVGFAGVS